MKEEQIRKDGAGSFIMKLKVDYAFKEVMADEMARAGFLAAVLGKDPVEIQNTRILDSFLNREHEDDKLGILDVRVLLADRTDIDIEIQLSKLAVWADRTLFYLSRMYAKQIRRGQEYHVFKKCISVSILDFILFNGWEGFYSRFHIREDTRHFQFTDKMEFHAIELPKLKQKPLDGCSRLELWARFINAEKMEEFTMIAEKDPYIKSAFDRLQSISRNEQKRLQYEARQKAILDYNQGMWEAEQRGIEIGEQRGEQRGIEIGEQRGVERMRRLQGLLIRDKRFDALARSAGDDAYLNQLMREYGMQDDVGESISPSHGRITK